MAVTQVVNGRKGVHMLFPKSGIPVPQK
uniref:Uncharacterized protein n=2 Tax=Tetraselmis sp. GSL018 TaxID=582737 RepID=A0A061SI26_9CHLO